MAQYYFQTQNLAVGYGGKPILRDICIGIERGEIVTLIGPNGAGKSTILKSITRQLRAIAGTVEISGSDLNALGYRDLAVRMAVVLTERVQPELMTCREVAAMGRYPYTGRLGILSRADEAKVDAALAAVRAEDLAERPFNAISDGQRQRVLLARAICQEPEIIVLDEPTSFLDIRHKLELLGILRDMARRQGITVIMSLHEIDLAQKISDKLLCVKGETVARFGPPEEVFAEAAIRELYDLEQGFYDPGFGSIELPRVEGAPQAFVLSGGGTGLPVYRRLQREGVPFAAGILAENDVDFRLARLLAVEVVTEAPFSPISELAAQRALALIETVPRVIDAGVTIGPGSRRLEELIRAAKELGKYEKGN